MDIPCAPILLDITIDGRPVKAVAQPTKQAFLYVFDRVTGKPIWPIVERPVAKGDVPGEWYSATQPFPTKPPAYDRQGFTLNDLVDFTPEIRAEAEKIASRYKLGPIFTPPSVSKAEGPLGTLTMPGSTGGTNWPGGSYDPESHILYVYSQSGLTSLGLVPGDPKRSGDFAWVQGVAGGGIRSNGGAGSDAGADSAAAASSGEATPGALNVNGIPLMKPPYGRITAFDMDKGDILWQVAHGETPDNVRNNPLLKGVTIPRTGRTGIVGTLVTKTLVISGEPGVFTTPSGQKGAMLRAYDKKTGKEVGAVYMPTQQSGTPMTYMLDGKQYIVVAIGGLGYTAELRAFRLP
jgi:quinoprotein glucose dehydrogenase